MNSSKKDQPTPFPPPGQRVDLGGYRLHISCQGEKAHPGDPTVILEAAGLGECCLTWALVQPEVAWFARVCAYDRAGYGWSDASPRPRTAQVMVEELHALLAGADIQGPLVLAGHSFGGMLARLYAHRYPESVAGMVLVDSAHEEQFLRFPESILKAQKPLEAMQAQQMEMLKGLIAGGALDPALLPVAPQLPAPVAQVYRGLYASDPKWTDTLKAELSALSESHAQVRNARITSLGDLPLIVLSHGLPVLQFPPEFGVPASDLEAYERTWQQMQSELAALSSNGKRVIAEGSGHAIHHEQPHRVTGAIRQVVAASRSF